jgi:uncharacterized protein (TIGR02594 family)
MMAFVLTIMSARLRDEPRDDAPNTAGRVLRTDLLEKVADPGVDGWWKVRVVTPGADPREGFLKSELLQEDEAEKPPEEIDEETFFEQVTNAARTFESSRDYLYALAVLESGVANIKSKSSSAFGPFQFMPATWKGMVEKYGADTKITNADIVLPGAQAAFAAIYTRDAATALVKAINRTPTSRELYLAHLLGTSGASAVLSAKLDQGIDVALRIYYKGTNADNAVVDRILSANKGLLMKGQSACTTAETLDRVEAKLDKGFEKAAKLVAKYGPPVTEVPGDQTDPPWLAIAEKELARKISEFPAGSSNPEVEKYFGATTHPPTTDKTPWCAAFVSWCMAESKLDAITKANLRSAWAPDWSKWGFSVGRPARGAVALTGPRVDGTPGHMGFVTGEIGDEIKLLSGNWGDKVADAKIPKTQVVGYRWLDWK